MHVHSYKGIDATADVEGTQNVNKQILISSAMYFRLINSLSDISKKEHICHQALISRVCQLGITASMSCSKCIITVSKVEICRYNNGLPAPVFHPIHLPPRTAIWHL